MPVLLVRHLTTYVYRQPVQLGQHRLMVRPRESHDQRMLDASLQITPTPATLRWTHDVFSNSVALATFAGRTPELRVESTVRLLHTPVCSAAFDMDPGAEHYPFSYDPADLPDLARSMERGHADPDRVLDRWARGFCRREGVGTHDLLVDMTHEIRRTLTYVARPEAGTQTPLQTLKLGRGTCRDFAVLMMEAVRSLGFAARFVSGYIHSPARASSRNRGGGSTHAWVQVFLPGAGWVEFDPTNGIVGNRDLVRVAVARDPHQAVPLSGTWTGFPSDYLRMEVEVDVTASAADDPQPLPLLLATLGQDQAS